MKTAKVLSGTYGSPWVETPSKSGDFKLFVDGRYIAAITLTDEGAIVVSGLHTVEFAEDA